MATATVPVQQRTRISDDERESRAEGIRHAIGHARMEGMHSSPFDEEQHARYIAGEIDIPEWIDAIKQHYGIA